MARTYYQPALSLLVLSLSLAFSTANPLVLKDASLLATRTLEARALPAGWTYRGCYVDNAFGGRILSNTQPGSNTNTQESCTQACITAGYTIAGVEYSSECYCGNAIVNGGALASADTDCGMACSGNAAEKCGGPNRMGIFATGTLTSRAPPAAQSAGLPGAWKYQGCITEGTNVRALPNQIIMATTNSATNCLSLCSQYGYGAGGMEYGRECYCGDASDVASSGSTTAPTTDCSVACTGDSNFLCGGGNRLSYYTWTGAPLANWATPTGAGAGRYDFYVPGVIIALVATQGINGKYVFTEKYGTGPPNTTGTYELDPTKVNAFPTMWRPLHVKTDVFCSAGLVLPDRSGRQINIGGWSGDSTYGVRLYIPDGSPGVPGTNDWQENRAELFLQNGRWYPSAMIMANGSILVVGGEQGSNGPPVPTLEILPKPAGGPTVLFMDWLQRTDPNNLYPFLAVLPSGGIFVAYYNEARILDASTFATIKTLPTEPGSVSQPGSGRTYPFQGTAVLLPQFAPYSDPLTILLCGGSNPGAAIALDNCIFTQPDAPNPQWTLERMPSRRVMPCISALPDGTYLILNGAKQGVAGFGLATLPNLGAILYDPSKPVGSRMSILATTIVARLYHSESLLMQDGRVMISGSDPQDGKNPQEYRIETFTPPYLLNGAARPSYTIANRDWSYGQQISIANVRTFTGAAPRFSLLGAESSTHGNSMGQRTLFPAVTCGGGACTVTAPPNANVCPPGWFQLWLLDGPTPSTSTWVRIGGDRAGLGNWPNFPDFTKPGVGPI